MYDDFARVLRKDVLNCHKDKVILDQTYAITKRVGLAQVIDVNYVVMFCFVLCRIVFCFVLLCRVVLFCIELNFLSSHS